MMTNNETSIVPANVYTILCHGSTHKIPLDAKYVINVYAMSIFVSLLVIPVVMLNTVAVSAILSSRSLHNPSNILLAGTAISDVLSALLGMIEWVIVWMMGVYQKENCLLYLFAVFTSHVLSHLSFIFVWLVSVDRYLAIFKPFWYEGTIALSNKLYVKLLMCYFVILCILTAISLFVIPDKSFIEQIIVLTVPFLIAHSVYVHISIYIHVGKVRRKISSLTKAVKRQQAESSFETSATDTNTAASAYEDSALPSNCRYQHQVNLSRLTCLMLVCLCVCYLPYMVIAGIKHIDASFRNEPLVNLLYMWSYATVCVNALMNPIIYAYRSIKIRRKMKSILKKIFVLKL